MTQHSGPQTQALGEWPMWSMPRGVLRIVAIVLALCAAGGFALGLQGTPEKGRLPGETPQAGSSTLLDAPDAKPLAEDLPPPPPVEEKKKPEDEKKEEVDPNEAAAVLPVPPPVVQPAKPADDKVGDLLDGVTPPPQEDPPH